MGRFKQKINEKPSINTKGLVGVIANKSNVVIDNSYIEKGTAFVNAFENSNVILKNCGTPEPLSETNENIVNKIADIGGNIKLIKELNHGSN